MESSVQPTHSNGDKRMKKDCLPTRSKLKLPLEEKFTLEEESNSDYKLKESKNRRAKTLPCNCDPTHLVATSLVLAVMGMIFFAFSICLLTGQISSPRQIGEKQRLYLENESIEPYSRQNLDFILKNKTTIEESMANDESSKNEDDDHQYFQHFLTTEDPSERNRIKKNNRIGKKQKPSIPEKKLNISISDRLRDFFRI